ELARVALAAASELGRLREREEQAGRGLSLLGGQEPVAARQCEPVRVANDRTAPDLHRHRQVTYQPPDHRELLRVLLAEVRRARPDRGKQLGHDGGDAPEVTGSRRTFE